jgi:hypothetical protein
MFENAVRNARVYTAQSEGRPEHALFLKYLANCYKNIANYALKNCRLRDAARCYLRAYRSDHRLSRLVPFA